jgi:hypothetical protein
MHKELPMTLSKKLRDDYLNMLLTERDELTKAKEMLFRLEAIRGKNLMVIAAYEHHRKIMDHMHEMILKHEKKVALLEAILEPMEELDIKEVNMEDYNICYGCGQNMTTFSDGSKICTNCHTLDKEQSDPVCCLCKSCDRQLAVGHKGAYCLTCLLENGGERE